MGTVTFSARGKKSVGGNNGFHKEKGGGGALGWGKRFETKRGREKGGGRGSMAAHRAMGKSRRKNVRSKGSSMRGYCRKESGGGGIMKTFKGKHSKTGCETVLAGGRE